MVIKVKNKNVTIPEEEISKNMKILEISQEEAVQLWLEDNGYLEENPEIAILTEKAKTAKISHEAKSGKPRKNTPRERKPDLEKISLIQILANALQEQGFNPEITNVSKIIEFKTESASYKVDLVKKRSK